MDELLFGLMWALLFTCEVVGERSAMIIMKYEQEFPKWRECFTRKSLNQNHKHNS